MQLLIPAITIKAALAGFAQLGLDQEQLLAPTGLDPTHFADPFATVPNDAFAQIWMEAFRQEPDPTLPIRAGLAIPYGEFGILDHLVGSSETIGEGFQILSLFLWLVSVKFDLRFTHQNGDWVWIENDEPSRFISESWTLALILERFSSNIPGFRIEQVHLSQSADLSPASFEALFGVPVVLGQPHSGIQLSPGVWGTQNSMANRLLHETLRSVAEQAEIKQFEEAPLIYAIRTRLPEALQSGVFSAEDIAAELGLSKRTLQRKLSAEHITFKELLDQYRHEQAMFLLQNGEQDMGSIAYALGYNEQSSFNRAFKRWTGKTPSNYLS